MLYILHVSSEKSVGSQRFLCQNYTTLARDRYGWKLHDGVRFKCLEIETFAAISACQNPQRLDVGSEPFEPNFTSGLQF